MGLSEIQKEKFSRDGYVILPASMGREEARRLEAEILRVLDEDEKARTGVKAFEQANRYRRFFLGLHRKSQMIREFVLSSAFTDVGFSLVGNEVDLYFTSTQTKTPDKGGSVDCHQDIAYDRERNEKRVICWTSITESHPDNGGLFVWPSSHKRGLLPHAPSRFFELDLCTVGVNLEDTVPVSMDPGEIMVIHNSLVHGSYPNRTKNTRVALLSGYQKPKTYSETELKIVLPVLRA